LLPPLLPLEFSAARNFCRGSSLSSRFIFQGPASVFRPGNFGGSGLASAGGPEVSSAEPCCDGGGCKIGPGAACANTREGQATPAAINIPQIEAIKVNRTLKFVLDSNTSPGSIYIYS